MKPSRLLGVCTLTVVLAGCTAPAPEPVKPMPPAYKAKFQFTPPAVAAPGSAKVSIALVTYRDNNTALNTFNSRFVNDLQAVLVARGYSVKGPFATKDEMTYSDKKGSDFILTYSVSGDMGFDNVTLADQPSYKVSSLPQAEQDRMWDQTYTRFLGVDMKNIRGEAANFKGDFRGSGKINLLLSESQSAEKLWTKTVDISAPLEPFETVQKHGLGTGESPKQAIEKTTFWDLSMANARERSLDGIYTNAFSAIWRHLDPAEMRGIKAQADEIKKKKVY